MKRNFLSVFLVMVSFGVSFAQENFGTSNLITDPVISRRCKALIKERQKKIEIRQRLNSLILKNQKILNELPQNKQTVKHKLEINHTQLKNNLRLTNIRIKAMEENIVRKGCPGIVI